MLFIHVITGLLATVALLSLRDNFSNSSLFIAIALIGFLTSWWQLRRDKSIPHLKLILNIVFIALTIKVLSSLFIGQPSDILSGLRKTWVYLLILSTFIIYSKRDYYLIQVLSFVLIIFSCFNQTTPGIIVFRYILAFFIIWIIALRSIGLLKDVEERKKIFHPKKWFYRELTIGIIFILTVIILTVPLYLLIPHFNISLPFLPRLVEQKYTTVYADFPGKSPMSFLSRSLKKLTKSQGVKEEETSKESESEMELINLQKTQTKPIFWHSPEEYENILQELESQIEKTQNELDRIDKELKEISQKEKIPQIKELIEERKRLSERYEKLEENIEGLEKQQARLKEEYLKAVQEKNSAKVNQPENKNLLKSLGEDIQTKETDLKNTTNILKRQREELNKTREGMNEVRSNVYRQSGKSDVRTRIQKIWDEKEVLEEGLASLKRKISQKQKEYTRIISELATLPEQEDLEKEAEKKKEVSLFDLLIRVLILVIFLISLFLLYCIVAFFLSYWREKNKFRRAVLKNKHNLTIILLYIFLCRILNIFGYRYPVIIDPEDYAMKISQRFKNLVSDYNQITVLFLEARYSTHKIIKAQVEKALNSYRGVLKELKNSGSFWQRVILKLDFVFKL